MTRHVSRHAVLSETPTYDDKSRLRVVIETPKGSQVKYAYNPVCDCFELKTVMPEGMTFPYDFGFVPSTLGEDGDPLDVLVLMDFPVVPGCILTVRPIGAIKAEQKDKGKKWARNDRLISVATHARIHDEARSLKDLGPHLARLHSPCWLYTRETPSWGCRSEEGGDNVSPAREIGVRHGGRSLHPAACAAGE